MKRASEDQPWTENYIPLRDWLRKHEMRCEQQIAVGGTKYRPDAYIEHWRAPGALLGVWVIVRSKKMGWDLLTGISSNSVTETIADAERRMGFHDVEGQRGT